MSTRVDDHAAPTPRLIERRSPTTGGPLRSIAITEPAALAAAVARARAAAPGWRGHPARAPPRPPRAPPLARPRPRRRVRAPPQRRDGEALDRDPRPRAPLHPCLPRLPPQERRQGARPSQGQDPDPLPWQGELHRALPSRRRRHHRPPGTSPSSSRSCRSSRPSPPATRSCSSPLRSPPRAARSSASSPPRSSSPPASSRVVQGGRRRRSRALPRRRRHDLLHRALSRPAARSWPPLRSAPIPVELELGGKGRHDPLRRRAPRAGRPRRRLGAASPTPARPASLSSGSSRSSRSTTASSSWSSASSISSGRGAPEDDADVGPMIFEGQLRIVDRHVPRRHRRRSASAPRRPAPRSTR
jgi:hypothetical protein